MKCLILAFTFLCCVPALAMDVDLRTNQPPSLLEQMLVIDAQSKLLEVSARPMDTFSPKHRRLLEQHALQHGRKLTNNRDQELLDTVTALRNLSRTNKHFNKLINNEFNTNIIIATLAHGFNISCHEAAGLLATRGTFKWLIHNMPTQERKIIEPIIIASRNISTASTNACFRTCFCVHTPSDEDPKVTIISRLCGEQEAETLEKLYTTLQEHNSILKKEVMEAAIRLNYISACAALLQAKEIIDTATITDIIRHPFATSSPSVLSLFLVKGAKPREYAYRGRVFCSLLGNIVRRPTPQLTIRLLAQYEDVNKAFSGGLTALENAVGSDQVQNTYTLLDLGADPSVVPIPIAQNRAIQQMLVDARVKKSQDRSAAAAAI